MESARGKCQLRILNFIGNHRRNALRDLGIRHPYGISTDTLKNLSAAFVGECHAASVKFVLPQTV